MKYYIPAFIAVALMVPLGASALTQQEIAAQAQALLNQVIQIQQQLGVSGGATVPTVGAPVSTTRSIAACPQVGVTLKFGSTGSDVSRLQQFLALDPAIYPEGLVTGYYGALTQSAVQRWQAKFNIVSAGTPATTGYGVFGPKTAAAVALQCPRALSGAGGSGGSANADGILSGFIKVSPRSGPAPLKITVEATVNTARACTGGLYVLSWGDGSTPQSIIVPPQQCETLSKTYTHTYANDGTYAVTLTAGVHESTVSVTVGEGGAVTTSQSNEVTSENISSQTNQTSTTPGYDAASGVLTIVMNGNTYTPSSATISSGTEVTWVNEDTAPHTVTADNGSYSSGTITAGGSYSLTFTIPGDYTYYDGFNGGPGGVGMSGRLTVE